ncbi:MAG: hypothetical protein JWL92_81 [Candidatus Nomurabacteria bacterium]|nr:hypothetical protein [Candidatus Nomurabacteria bacterium]
MYEIITEFLWNIHTNRLAGLESAEKEETDAIKNISLSKLLFEHTLLSTEFKAKPKKSVLKNLVTQTLEKFSSVATWLKNERKETILYTLLVNYRIVNM